MRESSWDEENSGLVGEERGVIRPSKSERFVRGKGIVRQAVDERKGETRVAGTERR